MTPEIQLELIHELSSIVREADKKTRNTDPGIELRKFLKKNFDLNKDELSSVVNSLRDRAKEPAGNKKDPKVGIIDKIVSYLNVLNIRPRGFDPQDIDFPKLRLLIANRKVRLKKTIQG
jgi:hypothetical protein